MPVDLEPSGVGPIDELVGGLPTKQMTFVTGTPRTGKTWFALCYLSSVLDRGARCCYVSTDRPESVMRCAQEYLERDLRPFLNNQQLTVLNLGLSFSSKIRSLGSVARPFSELASVAKRRQIAHFIFDTLDPVLAATQIENVKPFAQDVISALSELEATCVCTSLADGSDGVRFGAQELASLVPLLVEVRGTDARRELMIRSCSWVQNRLRPIAVSLQAGTGFVAAALDGDDLGGTTTELSPVDIEEADTPAVPPPPRPLTPANGTTSVAGSATLGSATENNGGTKSARRKLPPPNRTLVDRAQGLLRKIPLDEPTGPDRLVQELLQLGDMRVVESAMRQRVSSANESEWPQLLAVARKVGVVERALRCIRHDAATMSQQSAAVSLLATLRAPEAVAGIAHVLCKEKPAELKQAANAELARFIGGDSATLFIEALAYADEQESAWISRQLVERGGTVLDMLLPALTDDAETPQRRWVAQILAEIGDTRAIAPLRLRLLDRDETVRCAACRALGKMGDTDSLDRLADLTMSDPAPAVRVEAARALAKLSGGQIAPQLVAALSHPDYATQLRALDALELIRPQGATELIEPLLRDGGTEVRRHAANTLQRLGSVSDKIAELAGARRERMHAQRWLVQLGRAGTSDVFLPYLRHEDFRLRARLGQILGEIGDNRSLGGLAVLLDDAMWPVRLRAAEALASVAPTDALERLEPLLADPEEAVRVAALKAIRQVTREVDDEQKLKLVSWYESANAEVRQLIIELVGRIPGTRVDALLKRALTDRNPNVRLPAVEAIGARKSESWGDLLVERLSDRDLDVRCAAARSIGEFDTEKGKEALVACVERPEPEFRAVLAEVLARQGVSIVQRLTGTDAPEEAAATLAQQSIAYTQTVLAIVGCLAENQMAPLLLYCLRDPRAAIRRVAAQNVGPWSRDTLTDSLLALLSDRDPAVRAACVSALGLVGKASAVAALGPCLLDPDPAVRQQVPLALGHIGGANADKALREAVGIEDSTEFRAAVLVGFGLIGSETSLKVALTGLAHGETRSGMLKILAEAQPPLRQRFYANLGLDPHIAPANTAGALARHYANTIGSSAQAEERAGAVSALQALGANEHTDLLLDTVKTDPSPKVRGLALRALSKALGAESEISAAICARALSDPSPWVQAEAARGLGATGDGQYTLPLLRSLLTRDESLRQAAIESLLALSHGDSSKLLAALAHIEAQGELRIEPILCGAAQVLGEIGDGECSAKLAGWRKHSSANVRTAAVRALGQLRRLESKQLLIESLGDPVADVRLAAADGLMPVAGEDVQQALCGLAQDPSKEVRIALARRLASRREQGTLDILEALLEAVEPEVRVEALCSLVQLRDTHALHRFAELAAQQPAAVAEALQGLTGEHPALTCVRDMMLSDPIPAARIAAIRAQALIGQPDVGQLLGVLSDAVADVRLAAVEALRDADDQLVDAAFEPLISDPDPRVRDAVRRRKLSVVESAG